MIKNRTNDNPYEVLDLYNTKQTGYMMSPSYEYNKQLELIQKLIHYTKEVYRVHKQEDHLKYDVKKERLSKDIFQFIKEHSCLRELILNELISKNVFDIYCTKVIKSESVKKEN